MKDKKNEILRIAINLEGDSKKEFEAVQKSLGIRNRTDVLRWLIKWYHDRELKST